MSSSGSLGQLLGTIQKEIDLFEQRLDEMLQADVEMVHDVARYMATLKGKRLRPALIVLCARATGHWDDRTRRIFRYNRVGRNRCRSRC